MLPRDVTDGYGDMTMVMSVLFRGCRDCVGATNQFVYSIQMFFVFELPLCRALENQHHAYAGLVKSHQTEEPEAANGEKQRLSVEAES